MNKSDSQEITPINAEKPPAIAAAIVPNQPSDHEEVLLATDTFMLEENLPILSGVEQSNAWQDKLVSPWVMTAGGLFLLSNLGLIGGQLNNIRPPVISSSEVNPAPVRESFSVADSLNLAKNSPSSLSLDTLSTLPPEVAAVAITPPTPELPLTTSNLTEALLPPFLQPQLASPPYAVAQPSVSVPPPHPVKIAPPPQKNSVVMPPPTAVAPPVTITPPPPANAPTITPEDRLRQTMRQQLQMEQENQPPLGFNQRTRLEMQSHINQVDPALLPAQIQQLQQLQQRQQP